MKCWNAFKSAVRAWAKDDITDKRAARYGTIAGLLSLALAIWTFAGVMNATFVALVSVVVAWFGLIPVAKQVEDRWGKDALVLATILAVCVPLALLLGVAYALDLTFTFPWQEP